MKELWQNINGYDGEYQVSNLGRIKSLKKGKERILKPRRCKRRGLLRYEYVVLSKNNKTETLYIHRIVAEHFIGNPLNKPYVNHKDGDKSNNMVENLEWVTPLENNLHSIRVLSKHPMKGFKYDKNANSKKVCQYSLSEDGYMYHLATYASIKVAAIINNLNERSIGYCCNLKSDYQQVGGYIWRFKDNK